MSSCATSIHLTFIYKGVDNTCFLETARPKTFIYGKSKTDLTCTGLFKHVFQSA